MGRAAKAAGAAALTIAMLGAGTALTGCSQRPPQATVLSGDRLPSSGLTPVQRGRIRSAVLKTAHDGYDAWMRNDVTGMKRTWAKTYIDYYQKLYAGYAKAGKKRVRKHDVKNFDMVELNGKGDEAIVQVFFVDRSYLTDMRGAAITKPSGRETYLQFTLKKAANGSWSITRAIMSKDIME